MPMKQTLLERQAPISEEAIDELEQLLRTKIDLKTGYAEAHALSRTMHVAMKALDLTDDGRLDVTAFHAVLTKMNCGHNKPVVVGLFNRHDVKGQGLLEMKAFSQELFGLKRVAGSNPEARNVIAIVRAKLLERGGENGFRGLTRTLRIMDDNGNKNLDHAELKNGLQTYGIDLPKEDMETLMHFFDRDGNGNINVTEFVCGLRPNMSGARLALVKLAFLRLDKNPDGTVTMEELHELYDTDRHPAVLKGTKTPDEVMQVFASSWDKDGNSEITEAEFIDYYKDLSASIDNDTYFELMIRNSWRIAGGKGQAQNTANLRVMVTHLDGTQTVERLINDLGVDVDNNQTLVAALRKQGVTDILKVSTAGVC